MFTLNKLRAFGVPFPKRAEGEGEGSSETSECAEYRNPSPQSSLLLQGERRERSHRWWSVCDPELGRKRRFRLTNNARARGLWIAALLVAAGRALLAANGVPIYIEDNHAGTFYWLAQNIDLDQSCTLVLFDAHSDASGIFDSDKIRSALRNVASKQDRQTLLDRWRTKGTVQCFNWIEPLMPAPIAKVIWVPAEKLSSAEIRGRTQEATAFLDGHLEASPRKSGSLRGSYVVSDFESLQKHLAPTEPLVITIDLDYFAGLPVAEQGTAFERIWNFVIERPNLRAITFAI